MVAAPRTSEPVQLARPIVIVSAPRAGSSLLFETLSLARGLWTVGGESHDVIEGLDALTPAAHGWHSNRLTAADADPDTVVRLTERFLKQMRSRTGRLPTSRDRAIRLLEKTPRNALRIPFFAAAFPHASFVFLHRDAKDTVASMLEGWRSERYVSYRQLPGWTGRPWSFLLVPGWATLSARPLAELVACQWASTSRIMLDDLAALPHERWEVCRYDRLVADPAAEIGRLAAALGIV